MVNVVAFLTADCYVHIVNNIYVLLHADINECLRHLDECDPNAACANTVGGYTCTCNYGYEGDGYTCTSEYMFC